MSSEKVNFFHVDFDSLFCYSKPMKDRQFIGKAIKARRKELKITAEELAKRVGVDRTYISKMERHGYIPSPVVFAKILSIFTEEQCKTLMALYFTLQFTGLEILGKQLRKFEKAIKAQSPGFRTRQKSP